MNEVTLAVAAKESFGSGILRFLTPGLTEMEILISFEKGESDLTLQVQPGLEDWQERMDHLREARRICMDLHLCLYTFSFVHKYLMFCTLRLNPVFFNLQLHSLTFCSVHSP